MTTYKTVVITGGNSGIGAAIAKKYCVNGSTVYALARNTTKLNEIKMSLPKRYQAHFITEKCDVTDKQQVVRVFKNIFRQQPVDLVISNAGMGYSKPFIKYTDKETTDVVATNLLGTINVVKAALKFRKRRPLQIACTSSLAGKIGFPDMSIYSASKFGLEGLIESLRNEYDKNDVAFTVVRPGITKTSFFKKAGMQEFEKSVKDLKCYYSPERVADIFFKKLSWSRSTIVVGNDKYFLAILPFIPFRHRFKILDLINKL